MSSLRNVDIKKINKITESGNYIIVDVRGIKEYKIYHIEGAVNIPYEHFEKEVWRIPKEKKVAVYCESGNRSIQAAEILYKKGYDVVNLMGGIKVLTK